MPRSAAWRRAAIRTASPAGSQDCTRDRSRTSRLVPGHSAPVRRSRSAEAAAKPRSPSRPHDGRAGWQIRPLSRRHCAGAGHDEDSEPAAGTVIAARMAGEGLGPDAMGPAADE